MTETIKSRLSGLETPLRKSAGLAYSVRAFANSGELTKEAANALDALAATLMDELSDIFAEWESIFKRCMRARTDVPYPASRDLRGHLALPAGSLSLPGGLQARDTRAVADGRRKEARLGCFLLRQTPVKVGARQRAGLFFMPAYEWKTAPALSNWGRQLYFRKGLGAEYPGRLGETAAAL